VVRSNQELFTFMRTPRHRTNVSSILFPECAISSQVELKDTSGIAYTGCFKVKRHEKLTTMVHVTQIL